MKNPLISIITPVYNSENFIEQTIRAIQEQSYTNWEVIFVDDCSDDDSVNLIKHAQKSDERIKLIRQKVNSGAAKARNQGTIAANGRYIAFLDADDLWERNKLEIQLRFSLDNAYSFVFSSYKFANEKGLPTTGPVKVPLSINYRQALKNHIIWTSTVFIDTKNIDKKLILMPDVRRGQDAATWWKILRVTKENAYGMQDVTALYRRTNASLSANKMKAIKRTWYLYREVEKLNLFDSSINFCFYAFNAVRKRI